MLTFNDLRHMFNRSVRHSYEASKWLLTSLVLFATGLFILVSSELSYHTHPWISLSLIFLPIFICSGIWIALGIVLIRVYHDEVKRRTYTYGKIFSGSLELLLGSAYATVPILLLFIILWMLLGFFMLLQSVPLVGSFFSVLFAFAPFLLNLAALLMCIGIILILFYVTPILALRGLNRSVILEILSLRWGGDLFSNLLSLFIATVPLIIYIGILTFAVYLTRNICAMEHDPVKGSLQGFFMMIPFAFLLAPAVIFFFNFAAESHAHYVKKK